MSWLKESKFFILLLFVLSIPAILPLLHQGFFVSDDGEWMVIRFSAFHQALVDGQFPVRFLGRLNHEYGYPVANFLYPGFMYLAEIPKIIGFGFVDSIKIILGASMLGSLLFTFFWLRAFFGILPAFFGSLLYLYSPYHLFDIYRRGSVGEIVALSVIPFILWMIERKSASFTALGIALLILSHNTLALLFLPLVVGYMMLRKTFSIRGQIQSIFLGLLTSAFFWVPAILDLQFTKFSQTQVSDWAAYFVGYDLIGISAILVFLLTISLFFTKYLPKNKRRLTGAFFSLGVASLFLSTRASSSIWEVLPVSFIQFPFRMLSLTIVAASFLIASIVFSFPRKGFILGLILATLSVAFSLPFMTPSEYFDKGEGFYTTNMATTTVKNEYTPKWVEIPVTERPAKPVQFVVGNGSIDTVSATNKEIRFKVRTEEESFVRIHKHFFPGWTAFVNGREEIIYYKNPQGVIDIGVPIGESAILLRFEETGVRLLSDVVSLLGFLGIGILMRKKQ